MFHTKVRRHGKSLGVLTLRVSELLSKMTFAEILNELPMLTFKQRQELVLRVVELDDLPPCPDDEALVSERLAAHHADPASSLPVDEVIARLTGLFPR